MTKLALYRKYRPQGFGDVLGQDHIVTILKNSVKLNRISHAYLFSGPRGTGKTSVARILAKEIGCIDVDLVEIDAASSRGIDEIRALREAVNFLPLESKVKVYIIDEVHMLTKEAFNALLKTLEEPPAHVIFILATTELEKVPETIISRCQNFSFHKIQENVLRNATIAVAKKEGFSLDSEAASLIALSAEGSFRDALGLLDQIVSLADQNKDKKITGQEAREFLSIPSREIIEKFIIALIEKKAEEGMETIQKTAEQNMDSRIFLKLILRDIRALLLLRLAPGMREKLKELMDEREFNFLEKIKDKPQSGDLELALKVFLDAFETRQHSYMPYLPLELAFVKIINRKT
ncbi:DNA polymerase III subunit gamma/tau [Patescibacteria group bacterium]|nr:DNA polymerase III subunit gamma/tau [Patescibacteria group bacterium]